MSCDLMRATKSMPHWEVFYFGVPACLANSIVTNQWLEAGVAPGIQTYILTAQLADRQTDRHRRGDTQTDSGRQTDRHLHYERQA